MHLMCKMSRINYLDIAFNITGQLLGGHFKFHDFFCSLGIDREQPFKITPTTTYEGIMSALKSYRKGFIDLKPLVEASPFPIKCKIIK